MEATDMRILVMKTVYPSHQSTNKYGNQQIHMGVNNFIYKASSTNNSRISEFKRL